MTTIYTVDVAKFTAAVTGDPVGTVDVCRDDDGFVHLRINANGDEVVLRIHRDQARRVRNMIDRAIDGIIPMGHTREYNCFGGY